MSNKDLKFSFIFETKTKMIVETHNLGNKKACQESNIQVKIIEGNIDIFSEFIFHNFNSSIYFATFPSELKDANAIWFLKRKIETMLETILQ